VRRFREMTEAGLAAAGAANRHDSLPVLRMLDFGRTRRRLAGIARARRQFGQSILGDYRRRYPHPKEKTTTTMLGRLRGRCSGTCSGSRRRSSRRSISTTWSFAPCAW
jgi:hypothetical protein